MTTSNSILYYNQTYQMKTKTKLHPQTKRKDFPHVDFSDYPQKEYQKDEIGGQRRFFTSKHEEIDKQDKVSACLSIEKELPELAIRTQHTPSIEQRLVLSNLINENKLKDEALAKATKMITLLQEENAQLNAKVQLLEIHLIQKDSIIESLETQLGLNSSEDRNVSKDARTERNRHSVHLSCSKIQKRTPREQKLKQEVSKTKSDFFFEFMHSKQKQKEVRKSHNTLFSTENQKFTELKQRNISKKLLPCFSKTAVSKNMSEVAQNQTAVSITEQLGMLILQEQIQNNRYLSEQLKQLISVENEDLLVFETDFQRLQREVTEESEEPFFQSYFQNSVKAKAEKSETSLKNVSTSSIIQDYQKLIHHYRQYAAYLKSYLCESLNFMHNRVDYCLPQLSNPSNFSSVLSKVTKQITKVLKQHLGGVWDQNRELKSIIEQLIKNIGVAHKKQVELFCKAQIALNQSQ